VAFFFLVNQTGGPWGYALVLRTP